MNKKIMVCVTQQRTCEILIKEGNRLRKDDDKLIIINIVNDKKKFLNFKEDSVALEYLISMAKKYDSELQVIRSKNTIKSLIQFAIENKVNTILLGHTNDPSKNNIILKSLMDKLPDTEIIEI